MSQRLTSTLAAGAITGLLAAWSAGAGAASFTPLGFLSSDPNGQFSNAWGVSSDGSAVVGVSTSGSAYEAFRWTAGDGMVGLGFLDPNGFTEGHAASADGSVAVGWSYGSPAIEAFRWTSGGGMQGLGFLTSDPNFQSSLAVDVSSDGSVIAGTSGPEGFRWCMRSPTTGTRSWERPPAV